LLSKEWFQLRIIMYYLLILVGGAASLSFYLYRFSHRAIRQELFGGHSVASSPWEILKEGILVANGVATGAVIVVAVATTFFIVRSISGAAGNLTENLRFTLGGGSPRDWKEPRGIYEFQHLHRLFAETCDTHHRRVEELEMMSRILAEKAEAARLLVEKEGDVAGHAALRDLHVQCEKFKGAVDRFTLEE
jgi:hypothetical protein